MSTAIQASRRPAPATTPPAATRDPRASLGQLRRFQWAVRATLAVGVAASVCANVLNARDNPISQAIAAWPPLALLLTVELVSRVPVHRRLLGVARIGGTAVIAGIAAYVSYFHMAAVVSRYGEHQPNPYLLPLSVDGLIVVASVSLVELSGRLRAALDHVALDPAALERAAIEQQAVPIVPSDTMKEATAPVDVVPSGSAKPAGGDQATTGDLDRALPAPPPARPVQPVNGAKPNMGNHNGRRVRDRDGDPLSIPLTPLPPAAAPTDAATPATLASARDAAARRDGGSDLDADPDLVALLPAARDARDELLRQGRSLSRDSLARQLRRHGHTIRTARVSELLTLLKNDPTEPINGRQAPSRQ
jgi:Protein of unknown function (DUF2637)